MTQNATWCQNRGCICISSVRRTYGQIHIPASTIILWTELFPKKRREKIQGENFNLSSVQLESKSISSNSTRVTRFLRIQCILQELQCFHTQSSNSKIILHTELILPQEFSKKYYNYKAHPVQISTRHLPVTAPVSPSILHGRIRLPAPYSTSRLPVILPSRNSIPSGSQHPHNPYSSSQAHSYRILLGEIGFIPKGLSIVCSCNTKVSVFQFTYSCA